MVLSNRQRASIVDGESAAAAVLAEDDIRRTLMRFRFDHEFRGAGGRVPIRIFADFVNVSPQALYKLMAGAHLRYDTRARIAAGIAFVLNRGLRWRRKNDIWEPNLPLASIMQYARQFNDDHPHL